MKYLKTVCVAIAFCMVALIIRSAVRSIMSVLGGEATGSIFLEHGLMQLALVAVLVGWLAGSLWYGVRRFVLRTR